VHFLRRAVVIIAAILVAGAAAAWWVLRASLPALDGEIELAGLGGTVTVERDANGVPTVTAGNREDLARATGFVHAQDRFFQMDLLRRQAAGELSALFGPAAIPADRKLRLHRFRTLAERIVSDARADHRALLAAYADGVNAGLAALSARPFEYLLLRQTPRKWQPADSMLVLYAMFLELHDERADRESELALMGAVLPQALVAFLAPAGTPWDAPLTGPALPVPEIPGPEVFDLRNRDTAERLPAAAALPALREPVTPGSNSWVLAGSRTASGRALVANDMHLPLRVPNIFYRARLKVTGTRPLDLAGVTLPGVPSLVAGSNGRVAWGFTNSYGDWADLVDLVLDPENRDRYRTPDGWRSIEKHPERIEVAGADPVEMQVPWTIWGPVLPAEEGRPTRALVWLAHQPGGANFGLLDMEHAAGVADALELANRAGIPPQNVVIGDADGNIAWTIAGMIPVRQGFDPARPGDWSRPGTGWQGWVDPADYPRIVNPPGGRIWTANARLVDGPWLALIGDGGYALGARAGQIRDGLAGMQRADTADMLAVHLDDRALFLDPWRTLLLDLPWNARSDSDDRAAFRAAVQTWNGRASVDAVGFRLVFEFRQRVYETVFAALTAPLLEQDPAFGFQATRQAEGALWRLVTERPDHLLPRPWENWEAFLLAMVDDTVAGIGGDPLASPWGQANRAAIRHPLSNAIPALSAWLDMPEDPLPGAVHMPRVQRNSFGASERFAVSPGAEDQGYLHLPGGISGHPLSPFYRSGHEAWVAGEPVPFLPGDTVHHLTLAP
jgi:penicillin amidase